MIKTVFFDLYYTLIRYEPPQEELVSRALKEIGIDASPKVFQRPLVAANEYIYQEIARRPLSQRSKEEIKSLYAQYQRIVLEEGGIKTDEKLILTILGKMQQFKTKLALFDDVIPVLNALKKRDLILGLISNVEHDITASLDELGLSSLLDIVVTSLDSGSSKPQPGIFKEATRRAGIQPSEAIYVGDQYQIDYVGAENAGLKGILIDRGSYFSDIPGCRRIKSLTEVAQHLE
jgi:putative hydrolase of the HAD superfamily